MQTQVDNIVTHEKPVWKAKADFLILVDLDRWGLSGRFEQLWARRMQENLVELCCIPFFPYGIRLGDIVEIRTLSEGEHYFERVAKPSNRLNVRLVVDDPELLEAITPVLCVALEDARCEYEVFKPGYIAADVPSGSAERYLMREMKRLSEGGQVTIERV